MPDSALIGELREDCRLGRTAIAGTFAAGAVRPAGEPSVYAWSQYLDVVDKAAETDLGHHYGIFGTSAAVQVLAMQSPAEFELLLSAGLRVLPKVGGKDTDDDLEAVHGHFVSKGDLDVVYKVCALLDAANALCAMPDRPPHLHADVDHVLEHLLQMRIGESGWPDYSSEREYQGANAHATAVALLSISRCSPIPQAATHACLEALRWFANQPVEHQSIATLSMLVSAVNRMSAVHEIGDSREVRKLLDASEQALEAWIKLTSPLEIQRSLEATDYWLPLEAHREHPGDSFRFAFLLYLPHCLAALAALESPRLRQVSACRRFVIAAVRIVATGAKDRGHFVAAGRTLVSTVEHL